MKSSAPWSVKGIERDARETAKEAAKREGMTVGEWLNHMIYSAGEAESSGGDIEGLKLRDLVTAIEHLHRRVGESATKNADAVNDLTRSLGGAVERLQRLERAGPPEGGVGVPAELLDRVEKLERAGGDRQRIDALRALEKAVAQVAAQFNTAHKASLERLDATERQLQQLASRIDQGVVGASDGDASSVNFLKDAIDGLSARIARAERIASEAAKLKEAAATSADPKFVERTGERLRVLGDEIKRGGDQIRTLEATIGKLSAQIEAAERRSSEGVQKVAETIAEMRENFGGGETGRAEIEQAVSAAQRETEARIAKLQSSFDRMIEKLDTLSGVRSTAESTAEVESVASEVQVAPASFEIEEEDDEDPFALFDDLEDTPAAAEHIEGQTDEPAASVAPGEDEDDPFGFIADATDEIDDALSDFGDDEASDKADDFSFEIDDEPAASQQSQSLLDEVRAAFGARERSPSLDDASTAEITGSADPDAKARERAAAKAMLIGKPPQVVKPADVSLGDDKTEEEAAPEGAQSVEPEDYLRAARRRAQEAAVRAAADEKSGKRKLTPKQRAILAARARKRKELENALASKSPTLAAAKPVAPDDKLDIEDDDEDNAKSSSKFEALFKALKTKLPGKHKTDSETPEIESEPDEAKASSDAEDHRTAFATLKSTAAARPLTLILGVAICLSIAALFFLVKDMIFRPAAPAPVRPAAQAQSEPIQAASAPDTQISATTADTRLSNAPDAATINPRDVFVDATADLRAAATDAETRAAIEKLQQSAALGYPPAQLQLGELYRSGQAIDQDLGQARLWFRRAANGGNVLAMHRIGIMTARGDGGPEDSTEAIAWFEAAGNHGLVDSQYNLGTIFHPRSDNGGALSDAEKSYYWYSLAGRNGDTEAAETAGAIGAQLSAGERAAIDARVTAWTPLPADAEANEFSTANAG